MRDDSIKPETVGVSIEPVVIPEPVPLPNHPVELPQLDDYAKMVHRLTQDGGSYVVRMDPLTLMLRFKWSAK
jgi:hypothetical protein